jgi:glycosyltransferase involved in cell wall biosynthesis
MDATRLTGSTKSAVRGVPGIRVAFVHDWLTGLRGGEKCLEALCSVFPEATIHTLLHKPGSVGPTIEAMRIQTTPLQRLPGVFRHYRHLLPIMPMAARTWRIREVDLVVSFSHCVAKAALVPPGVPHVCYCFTPMRYAWEGRAAYLEGWAGRPVRRAATEFCLDRLREWDRATASRVTHFVAISETVRGRIARCYGRDSRVISPPVDAAFYTPAPIPRDGPYLCVSALVPYKRIDQAVAACTATKRPLIVIGEGPERTRLELSAGPTVSFLGWQPEAVVREHYRHCRALLFPGDEDFGIVPVEALACGAPVIALGRGGAAETVADGVGRLYPTPTTEGLRVALDRWEAAGRPHDPVLARQIAESLDRPLFVERLVGYLREVLADRVPRGPHLPVSPRAHPRARARSK